MIVASFSKVLFDLLLITPETDAIMVEFISLESMRKIIDYMYNGEAIISVDHLSSFIESAKYLQIEEFLEVDCSDWELNVKLNEDLLISFEKVDNEETPSEERFNKPSTTKHLNKPIKFKYVKDGLVKIESISNDNLHEIWNNVKKIKKKDGKFNCSFCDNKFSNTSNLRQHIKTFHFIARFRCPYCIKSFTRKGKKNMHIKNVHKECLN